MCGKTYPLPEAAHIVDCVEWKKTVGPESKDNGFPLCPNCHKVYDDVLRPYLAKALEKFGTNNLPKCWSKRRRVHITDSNLPIT